MRARGSLRFWGPTPNSVTALGLPSLETGIRSRLVRVFAPSPRSSPSRHPVTPTAAAPLAPAPRE
eukprot:4958099-Pyramimonas_sp.AAC.1